MKCIVANDHSNCHNFINCKRNDKTFQVRKYKIVLEHIDSRISNIQNIQLKSGCNPTYFCRYCNVFDSRSKVEFFMSEAFSI